MAAPLPAHIEPSCERKNGATSSTETPSRHLENCQISDDCSLKSAVQSTTWEATVAAEEGSEQVAGSLQGHVCDSPVETGLPVFCKTSVKPPCARPHAHTHMPSLLQNKILMSNSHFTTHISKNYFVRKTSLK